MNEAGGMSFEDYMSKRPVSVESESNATEEIDYKQLGEQMVQSANERLALLEEPLPTATEVSQEQGAESLSNNMDTLFGSGIGGMGATALGANPVGVTMASFAYPMHKTGTQIMEDRGIPQPNPFETLESGRPVDAFNDMIRPTAIGTIETMKGLGEMAMPEGSPDTFNSSAEREDYYRSDSASTSPSELIRSKN